jgi:hypothetical protein
MFKGNVGLENIRRVDLKALVDTGAAFPVLSKDKVDGLDLPISGEAEAEVTAGKKRG